MGQIVKRKRKGRPSDSDRARRKFSAAPPSPVERRRRSCRRRNVRYNFDIDDYVDDDEFDDDEEEDEEVVRREKKLRVLLCEDYSRSNRLVMHAPASSSSSSEDDNEEDDYVKPSKKRKIDEEDDEDDEIEEMRGRKLEEDEEEEEEEEDDDEEEASVAGGSDIDCEIASDHSKEVPLPDKKTLELILDKLQKKDIYGVYAEPVDPEELPDYHDVIKHPMDFATVRKKLARGCYLTLKEFESDVLLICTNAMQYNAPDTIYYKQASSIQEMAKLKFQRLRANVDQSEMESKSELKTTPTFSLPRKQLKKSVAWTSQDHVGSESFSSGNVRTGEFPNGSPAQTSVRPNSSEVLIADNSSLADDNLDKEEEVLPGKGFTPKLGRKPSVHDENRRATYNTSVQPVTESSSIFSTFESESKQLIPVGLHEDHSYARSLSRFAATLGSVAWKVASQTIEQALPQGVKFGHGWVGEYEPLSTPVLKSGNCTLKEANFLALFQKNPNTMDDEKVSKGSNNKTHKGSMNGKELNDSKHDSQKPPGPVKKDSLMETCQDHRPPFFSSLQGNPTLACSNFRHRKSLSRNFMKPEMVGLPQVELNHPPPTHVKATDFIATRPISNASDIPSPRPANPVSRNGNLASLASFKHPNGTNDGFVSGRPSNREPTPAGLDCNKMVPTDTNTPYRQEGKPIAISQECNRMVQEQPGLSDPVQTIKMLSKKAQHQHNNANSFGFGSGSPVGPKREDLNNTASPIPQFPSNPPQIYSQMGSKRDNSTNNAALTAAQAWMSLGGGKGFIKPPFSESINPHKQEISAESLYNSSRDHQFPVQGIQFQAEKKSYQQPIHSFIPQPNRPINEAHLQNRHVGFPQLVTTDLSRFQMQQPRPKQQESRPPDLNIGYQSPVRQSNSMLVDSQQPDLALQL